MHLVRPHSTLNTLCVCMWYLILSTVCMHALMATFFSPITVNITGVVGMRVKETALLPQMTPKNRIIWTTTVITYNCTELHMHNLKYVVADSQSSRSIFRT